MDVFYHVQQDPVPGSVILVLHQASDEADLGCKSKYLLPSAESMIQPSLSHRLFCLLKLFNLRAQLNILLESIL